VLSPRLRASRCRHAAPGSALEANEQLAALAGGPAAGENATLGEKLAVRDGELERVNPDQLSYWTTAWLDHPQANHR